jgi:peptide/nickel transport system substrate-binding protein
MNRLAAILLCLVASLATGCSSAHSHARDLRLGITIDPTSLSPLLAFDQNQIGLDQFWCQTLIGLDEHNRFIPILLTRIPSRANGDVSADGLRLTYHLRDGVRFADGVPFTSADVVFTYRAILDPANAAVTDSYRNIASLTAAGPHTVVVRLRRPWSAAPYVLFAQADFAYGILPAHAFSGTKIAGSAWEGAAFGTGPFRVASWRRGERIDLEANPYYRPRPKLARIVVRILPNESSAFGALQTHEVDAAELNADNLGQAAAISGLRVQRTPENGLRAFYLQTAAAPTNDVRVRRAIAYALDTAGLSRGWRGIYPAARSVFPASLAAWPPPPAYPHDLAQAGRELDAAGWRLHDNVRTKDGKPLTLLIAVNSEQADVTRIAVIAQQQLAAIGADATVKTYPPNLFTSPAGPLRTGNFALTPAALIGGADPEQSLNVLCTQARDGGTNYARFCSPQLDRLFAAQSSETRDEARRRDFAAMAAIVHDDVPLVPLYDLVYIEGVSLRVSGYERNMLRYPVRPENWDVAAQ